jgi:hypothetical protein
MIPLLNKAQADSLVWRTAAAHGNLVNLAGRQGKALRYYRGWQREPHFLYRSGSSRVSPVLLTHLVKIAHAK